MCGSKRSGKAAAAVILLLVVSIAIIASLTLSSAAVASDSGQVSVQVRVARVISVSSDGEVKSNVPFVAQAKVGFITYISP